MSGLHVLARTTFLTAVLVAVAALATAQEQVLHSFSYADGINPMASLTVDRAGNFYGTTFNGSVCNQGSIFELSPPGIEAGWTFANIYGLCSSDIAFGGDEGGNPSGSLILDSQGNLYGTTTVGVYWFPEAVARIAAARQEIKPPDCCEGPPPPGPGTVFELVKPTTAGGSWTLTPLFVFGQGGYGNGNPSGTVWLDSAGNAYAVNYPDGSGQAYRGCYGCGTVFELSPQAPGQLWSESTLYNFGSYLGDGLVPSPNLLVLDGAFYGTTQFGGTSSQGTVFKLAKQNGVWTETVLHNFRINEGGAPVGTLIADPSGNLYGTTFIDDNNHCQLGCGSVFELSPPAVVDGPWQETTLYSFTGGADGSRPQGGLVRDDNGNLYGTTTLGGTGNGVVFKLVAPTTGGGDWKAVTLHQFTGAPTDGSAPLGSLLLIGGTKLFGTTSLGGTDNEGTLFSVVIP
jgi:uncharacterized repeat protein (TIGR03803 family)